MHEQEQSSVPEREHSVSSDPLLSGSVNAQSLPPSNSPLSAALLPPSPQEAAVNVSLRHLLCSDNLQQPLRDVNDSYSPISVEVVDTRASFMSHFDGVSANEQLNIINDLLCSYAKRIHEVDVPPGFVSLSLRGMKHLENTGRINVIHELVKGLGTMRPDKSDSYFPTTRMPIGMLQYMIQFFNAKAGQSVCIPYFQFILVLL